MTPLIKPRRETDSEVASDMFLSSIAGSPRRVGNRPDGEGFGPAHDNPVRVSGSMIFHRRLAGPSLSANVTRPGTGGRELSSAHAPDVSRRRWNRHRLPASARGRRLADSRRLRAVPGVEGAAGAQ